MAWNSFSFTKTERNAVTGMRDPQRLAYLAANGVLPQFAWSSTVYTHYSQRSTRYDQWPKVNPKWSNSCDAEVWVNCSYSYTTPEFYSSRTNDAAMSLYARLNAQLNDKAKNQYHSVFETLYEGRQTKAMVAKAARDIALALRDVRRGRFERAAQTLGLKKTPGGVRKTRKLKDNWLEYRYGWTPIYLGVYNEMRRQYDRMKNQEPVRRVTVQASRTLPFLKENKGDLTTSNDSGLPFGLFAFRVKQDTDTTVNCKKVAYFRVHNPGLAQKAELGLTNPALVAWELVPLSFVVDWFVNVSDVLGQFDAWIGKTYIVGTNTTYVESTVRRYVTVLTAPDPAIYNATVYWLGQCIVAGKRTDRSVNNAPPSVMPEFQVSLNPARLTDAFALLGQAFSKRK